MKQKCSTGTAVKDKRPSITPCDVFTSCRSQRSCGFQGGFTPYVLSHLLTIGFRAHSVIWFISRDNTDTPKFFSFYPFTNCPAYVILLSVRGALAQLVAHNTGSVGVRSSSLLCSMEEKPLRNQGFLLLLRGILKENGWFSHILVKKQMIKMFQKALI